MSELPLRKKMLLGCISACLSGVLCLVAFEILLRVSRPRIDLYALTGRTLGPDPKSEWAVVDAFCAYRPRAGEYAPGKTVNSHGFLSTPELPREKPADTVRVVFLGGSSTAGTGDILKDTETWPWQTMERVRERVSAKVDFINAASGGYTSFESYGRLWSRLRFFSPDIVVVCHGWNEMYYFDRSDDMVSWRIRPDGSWSLATGSEPVAVYSPRRFDPLIRWSRALTWIRIRFSRSRYGELRRPRNTQLDTDFDRRGLSVWRTHLALLREACAIMGAKLLVVKQPTLLVPGLAEEQLRRCRLDYHGFDHDAHVSAFAAIYQVIDDEIARDAIIDLTSISGDPNCFFDHVHPTPEGCSRIAAITAQSIVSHIEQMDGVGQ